jgi:hypothetical protein
MYLYRLLFYRGGYGVHSPFVFDLITNVIEENAEYYSYPVLQAVREHIEYEDGRQTCSETGLTVKQALERYCMRPKEQRLLLRMANRFKARRIYAEGSDFALTPLYLTAYSPEARCQVYEPNKYVAQIAKKYAARYAKADSSVEITEEASITFPKLDLAVCGYTGARFELTRYERLLPYFYERSILIISGINRSRGAWRELSKRPEVSVTIDLERLGIVFFDPKLPRRSYKCFLPGKSVFFQQLADY